VLVEFSLVVLLLYLLIAGTVEMGRAVFYAQAAQSAARVAARELSLLPLTTTTTLPQALGLTAVKQNIYDPAKLVIDLDALPPGQALDDLFETLPLVNQALRPLMVFDEIEVGGSKKRLLRYPGALWQLPDGTLTVKIPRVDDRGANGVETITLLDVVEEIAPGTFAMNPNVAKSGVAGVRINVPYQAGMLSGYQQNPAGPYAPNLAFAIEADDGAVTVTSPPPGTAVGGASTTGVYGGPHGLGQLLAYGKEVRPFRKLVTAQSIYRREVFAKQNPN
jgi:hypothetical protein